MAASTTKARPPKGHKVQYPKQTQKSPVRRGLFTWVAVGLGVLVIGGIAVIASLRGSDDGAVSAAAGLPNTPDYHSLLVAPRDPQHLMLGTHNGLFESRDGGRTWSAAELAGQDAMNLVRPTGSTVWAAGHLVLAKSADAGQTWTDVRPSGLPGLDVHGFASDPRDPQTLYAAIAGRGLYRSPDGGASFSLVSQTVGPGVMALAVTPQGRILAGEMEQGLLVSADGGKTWRRTLEAGLMGLAINPETPSHILATGPGVLLSEDSGESWKRVLDIPASAGPVAWSPSNPDVAYVVGFDRTLNKSQDGGRTWKTVG